MDGSFPMSRCMQHLQGCPDVEHPLDTDADALDI
jgi:hypothetical protein